VTAFGRAMLEHWWLDPGVVDLHHGTVGATPKRVLDVQRELRETIERQPARYLLREWCRPTPGGRTRLRDAADTVAAFLGAKGDDLVFLDNATTAVNAVLRSLPLEPGDEIAITDHAYGAIANAAAFAAREAGARVVTIALPFPAGDPRASVDAVARALGARTKVAIVDHVSSETALVQPLAAIAAACRAAGVPVLADGAHAPGAIDLAIDALGVDWYAANLHKWAFAPRPCGVLWAAPERQRDLHPPVISWGLDRGWQHEFDWTGTRDPTAFLVAPEGIRFMTEFAGWQRMRAHNHRLAWDSALALGERWRLPWRTPESMVGCMVTAPLPAAAGAGVGAARRLQDRLLFERRIEAPIVARAGRLWVRISAQVYNETRDIDALADAVDALIA
jgi:isopenicillin-N epimerase